MTKDDMLKSMNDWLLAMHPMIIKSGCNPNRLIVKDAKYEEVESGYRWLKNLYEHQYSDVMVVYRLLPETIWQTYELMDCEEFREVKMLNEALEIMRKYINKERPDYFKRKKKNVKKDEPTAAE